MHRNKIDAAIAVKIMGWKYNEGLSCPWQAPNGSGLFLHPPCYSRDLYLAFQVMSRVAEGPERRTQFHCNVGRRLAVHCQNSRQGYWCNYERTVYAGEPDEFHAESDDPAEAICLASLMVIGENLHDYQSILIEDKA